MAMYGHGPVVTLLRAGLVEDGWPRSGGGVTHGERKDHETMGQDASEGVVEEVDGLTKIIVSWKKETV